MHFACSELGHGSRCKEIDSYYFVVIPINSLPRLALHFNFLFRQMDLRDEVHFDTKVGLVRRPVHLGVDSGRDSFCQG